LIFPRGRIGPCRPNITAHGLSKSFCFFLGRGKTRQFALFQLPLFLLRHTCFFLGRGKTRQFALFQLPLFLLRHTQLPSIMSPPKLYGLVPPKTQHSATSLPYWLVHLIWSCTASEKKIKEDKVKIFLVLFLNQVHCGLVWERLKEERVEWGNLLIGCIQIMQRVALLHGLVKDSLVFASSERETVNDSASVWPPYRFVVLLHSLVVVFYLSNCCIIFKFFFQFLG